MPLRICLVVALAALLGACAELTAENPLFSPSDQVGPPPLTEGVWLALSDKCSETNLRRSRYPAECSPTEIRRLPDGVWEARLRSDLVTHFSAAEREQALDLDNPMRFVIVPATERSTPDAFSPLYVAELVRTEEVSHIAYAVVAPIGPMPATEMRVIASIGCDRILADGPIEGVTPVYRTVTGEGGVEQQELSGCVASTPAAVREAARRALVRGVESLLDGRYVHVSR